jgi:hypothetical protein
MFDNTELKTLGMLTAEVHHPLTNQRLKMDFYVAATPKSAILGIEACRAMKLVYINENNICSILSETQSPETGSTSAQRKTRRKRPLTPVVETGSDTSVVTPLTRKSILARYGDIFKGVGLLDGDVHLEIDTSIPHVRMPARRLPTAIKQSVKEELEKLQRDGIIEPVLGPSEWSSALLVVRRPNSKIRIYYQT